MARTVYTAAPPRIDFGGGTLDIHPLYVYYDGGITINAGINLYAKVWLTEREDTQITIRSHDTGAEMVWTDGLETLPVDGPLALITRVLRYYKPTGGIDVQTKLLTPHGSGLGASSTLMVALTRALIAYNGGTDWDPMRTIRLCNNLEAQLMGMPAGMQDYFPAAYGGICAVHYDLEDIWVEPLDTEGSFIADLSRHIILTNTQITHHSGTTNWGKIRNFFDRVPRTVESVGRIKGTVLKFYDAFTARDIHRIGIVLNEEWENRKGMSDGVTNPEIDRMVQAALDAGAWGTRLCGAGGGGCMMTIAPPEKRAEVIAALEATGSSYMADVEVVRDGVQVVMGDAAPVPA